MSDDRDIGEVPDYTDAFLTTLAVILFLVLSGIGLLIGFVWAIAVAAAFDRIRLVIARRRSD